ncbi:FtsK/SpoIIIE domain-containing protein, partial [Streptomyces sp. URMC 123]|uniref:FtsK/SpoIIIE domain-containing protein n=1 Tax=Streptomyces sp. URMC 123 TaxID=3423403 RepID=UPI003F1DF344
MARFWRTAASARSGCGTPGSVHDSTPLRRAGLQRTSASSHGAIRTRLLDGTKLSFPKATVMILRLTVQDTGSTVRHDVEVIAEPESRVGAVLESLPVPVGSRKCFIGSVPLDPEATLASSPLLQGAVISVGAPGPVFRPVSEGAAGILRVTAGPDAGMAVRLLPGTHLIARNSAAAICLRESGVSRREHARLHISADARAVVVDSGSTNGTFVDGARITGPAVLGPETVLRIGANELRWTPRPPGGDQVARSADARLEFDRAFAATPTIPSAEITLPTSQSVPGNISARMVSALAPVGGAVLLALVTQRLIMLWIGLLGLVGYVVVQGIEEKQRREREAAFTAAKDAAKKAIDSHIAEERRVRLLLAPGPRETAQAALGESSGLWSGRLDSPHGLVLRVGLTDQPAAVRLRGEPWEGFRPPVVREVPATVDLRLTGVLGLVGPLEPVQSLMDWLLIQLGTLRSPADLRIVVIAAAGHDALAWARWLPHVDAGRDASMPCFIGNTDATRAARVQELQKLVRARSAERGAPAAQADYEVVVVLDGAVALRQLPGLDEVLRDGPSVGVYVICADRRTMNECRGLCEVGTDSLRLTRMPDDQPLDAEPDVFAEESPEAVARALAPMRDRLTLGSTHQALPAHVRFLDLLGIAEPGPEDVVALWDEGRGPRTRVVLGADASGPVTVDLAGQGPHTMLGGATGAGKSILLQTLVTSLLLANRPDELNLVLVDFKGGSAFLPFQHCPHVVALIRSTGETAADVFDDTAAARVLASVRAEVSRREVILARYDGEIDRYWKKRSTDSSLPPLPRLVLVFDEFARVLETSPDFLKELVNVAAKGRSLGMHLVLATQSLQGKLSPELRNNISLRISLRQNEPADSTEVLGTPDAAAIPGSLRGRGLILCTTDDARAPRPFQSGYLGAPPPSRTTRRTVVRTLTWTSMGVPRPAQHIATQGSATDQDLAIAAIEEAAQRSGLIAPFRPLLPPLPSALALEGLSRSQTGAVPATAVPFGLADNPAEQAQPAEFLDLAGTDRLLVAGGPQSGRTTFARALITSLVSRFRPDEVHLYVIEHHPSGLSDYAELPHCGGVLPAAQPDRIRRLITWLDGEVQQRSTSPAGGSPRPYLILLIDGWEHFEDHSDPTFTPTSLVTMLRGIITAGAPLGVHIVPLGGQDMLNHKLPTFYTRRLLLPFPKEDTRRAHLTSRMTSPPPLPGRAIDAATGRHIQICHPTAP